MEYVQFLKGLFIFFAFIVYGEILVYPNDNSIEQFNFLTENYLTLSTLSLISYVLYGIILAVLVY